MPNFGSWLSADLQPDHITVAADDGDRRLQPSSPGHWSSGDIAVAATIREGVLTVQLSAPTTTVKRLHVRWNLPSAIPSLRLLGDAWERGYGDLEWRGIAPERAMPWYFAGHDGTRTFCLGVRTGAAAFCFWQVDSSGISLWADVRSGGQGLQLGGRVLDVCAVVARVSLPGESAFDALHAFCRAMCPLPRNPEHPLYGHNDWYYAYGRNSAETILADCHRTVALSPDGPNRPFTVIDAGWHPLPESGPWDRGNAEFPDMPGLASKIRDAGSRPGIWIRPLAAAPETPDSWRLPRDRQFLDPSLPEVREHVAADIARLHGWGYELIKHDFTTYDILGKWGFEMGASPTADGWSFAAGHGQTTAEVIGDLYRAIREGAGRSLVLGCNTVSHLTAGIFEANRIGDDTSGRKWDRTRKMGVNSLAFRAAQHGAFYAVDADCVGITREIPWEKNRQWLDLVARSGTALFVSLAPDANGPAEQEALRAAFALAAKGPELGRPLDWMDTTNPRVWRFGKETDEYDWSGADGASPFPE